MEKRVDEDILPAGAGVAIQLTASYVLAAGAAAGLMYLASRQPEAVAAAMVVGVTLGLLCTATLQRSLYLTGLALSRLARGLPIEPLRSRMQWPLSDTVASVDALSRLVGEQARREHETSEYREQLLRKVGATAAQEERNRLARELHDSIKQQIFSISMSAAATEARWDSDPTGARSAVAGVQRSAQEALVEMEALLQQLRPGFLESVGLREALQTQCEALSYRIGADVTLERFELPPDDLLPPPAQEALFRVAQEALSNVARHARAHTVSVRIQQQDGSILLQVRDDGQGFDPGHTSYGSGLAGMRERAQSLGGNLEVESVPGKGTMVQVHIPLRRPPVAVSGIDELGELREKRRNAIKLGTLVEQITVTLVFLGVPISAVALGLAVALFNYGRLRIFAAQLAVRPGRGFAEDMRQEYQAQGLLAGALAIAGLCIPYVLVAERGGHLPLQTWQVVAVALVVEMLAAVAAFHWYRGIGRYLSRLTGSDRRHAAGQRLRSARISIGVWGSVVVIGLVAGFSLGFPPHTLNQWADDATLAVLVAWPLIDAVDYLRAMRWLKRFPPASI